MNAVVYDRYGPPDVLRLSERPAPKPKRDEVLVEVHAVGLNAADWHLLTADLFPVRLSSGLFRPRVPIVGSDLAGRVAQVGDGVTDFQPGDEVYGDISLTGHGCLAELTVAPAKRLAPKPSHLSFVEAAAVPMSAVTALQAVRNAGKLQTGQSVLIYGASGGVGTFAVQIARHLGGVVTAVCSTGKLDQARELGAQHVLDYTQEDVARSDLRFDLILGVNGFLPITAYRRMLKRGGRYVSVGGTGTQMFQGVVLGQLLSRPGGKRLRPSLAQPNRKDLETIATWLEAGAVRPVIDRVFDGLAEAPEALRYLGEGHASGKVVVRVTSASAGQEPPSSGG